MKVPEPRKLDSGTWYIQMRLNGVSVPVKAASAAECKRMAALIKAEYMAGKRQIAKADGTTLGEAIDAHMEQNKLGLSPATLRGYISIRNNRFGAYMNKPIKSVDWVRVCQEEAKKCSAKSMENAWGLASTAMRENGFNPPKIALPKVVEKEKEWLEHDQIKKLVAYLADKPSGIAALLALHSLRRSEICALTWDNVDLQKKTITVSGAAVFDKNQKLVQKQQNKTAKSRRAIPIMIPELTALLESEEDKTGLVVRCHPNTIRERVNSACRACGVPEVGVHGLRHSFASLAHHVGMPEAECMRIGGWSDYATMRKIYTHISERDIGMYANKMTEFYSG